ncbi:AI-2E family transporter [Roseivivax marinus]|uniref:AI-2E family transporter n=1 Tax=Roseivivax marinus TaxID=1379903 RepID=UPI0004BCD3B2|nr:AI-2E family transporter [Roseivivax marinus]
MTILASVTLVAALIVAKAFLMPIVLALLLNLVFSPVRRWASRRGVPPGLTSLAVVLVLFVGVGALALALSGPIQDYAQRGPEIAQQVESKLRSVSQMIERVSEAGKQVGEMAAGGDEEAERVVVAGPDPLTMLILSTPAVLAQACFTLILLFFLMSSGDLFYEKIVQAAPTFADKRRAIGVAYDIERKLSRYFATITVINFGLGAAIGIALWVLGMPNPLLFGVMGALLNFVPFIGAVLGMLLTFAIGIVTFDMLGQAALVAGVYFGLTAIEGQFVTPYAVGRRLELNPVIVFIAVAFWGWAWSVIGMFIAVPVLIAIRVFCENAERLQTVAIFLAGAEPEREPEPSKTAGAGR